VTALIWPPLLADFFFNLAFFSSVPVYLGLSFVGIVLGAAALVLARPRRSGRLALLLAQASILALPLVHTYHPAVTVNASQVSVHLPTQPGPYARVVKATQASVELRRCAYKLLGWDERDALYGEEICGTRHRYWEYAPNSDTCLRTVAAVPSDLFRQEVNRQVLSTLGVRSRLPSPYDERLHIVVPEPGLTSGQGMWIAFVARHVYGPEDVVVVSGGAHTP
jgi:hypothetical protein